MFTHLQIETTEANFSQPMREYILYCEAVRAVLRRRDAIQMEYEMTLEELKRKKAEKDQVIVIKVEKRRKQIITLSDNKLFRPSYINIK